ncbi:hypothetical protein GCM10009555_064110 [Acrocarpospora macrocephala]|uniref:Uncharacterized protein n=1 Tax=Acrocarpospora macrocephala TaxID=150177 RepID=A0A5M3WFA0_9ACTN|nr:hypothetical protein [Acrocarpospora macrocephala]GES07654.1 hypothetical protein Amac_012490 [Acrocarpospora macrocephala]
MTDLPPPDIDLQEITTRHHTARRLLTALSASTLTLADLWNSLHAALDDIPALCAEILRMRDDMTALYHSRADLLAAARATLSADHAGETDPLYYLRDELTQHTPPPSDDQGDTW